MSGSRVDNSSRWIELGLAVFVAGVLGTLLALGCINTGFGVDDIAMLRTFSIDEELAVRSVMANLEHGDLDPRGFYNYGYFYQGAAVRSLQLLARLGYDSTQVRTIATTMRTMSLVALAALLGSFLWLLRTFKVELPLACIFALLLGSTPALYLWSQRVHPDVLQALLVFLALCVVIRGSSLLHLAGAAAIAGVAFGTKYSGVFVLAPILVMAGADLLAGERRRGTPHTSGRFLLRTLALAAVFVAAWLATNPHVSSNLGEFLYDFGWERAHVARGHNRAESSNSLLWLVVLFRQLGVAGSLLVVIGLSAVTVTTVNSCRSSRTVADRVRTIVSDRTRLGVPVVALYCMVSLAFLMLQVNMREPRYTLHIVPALLAVACAGVGELVGRTPRRIRSLVLVAATLAILPSTLASVRAAAHPLAAGPHPHVVAGEWLRDNHPPASRILADVGSYVPPEFTNLLLLFRVSSEYVDSFRPDVLILNRSTTGKFYWKEPGTAYAESRFTLGDADRAREVLDDHRRLVSGEPAWHVVHESDRVVILERDGAQRTDRLPAAP